MSRVTSPPFTGRFDYTASLKIYQAKVDEAKSMMNTQTPEQARQMYVQALALAPDDYYLHGNFQDFWKGESGRAIAEAKRCCELVPRLPGGYYYTGTLLVREGRITEAVEYFSRALAIRGDYAEALDAMGKVLANQQKTPKPLPALNARSAQTRTTWNHTSILDFYSKAGERLTRAGQLLRRPRVGTGRPGGLFQSGQRRGRPGPMGRSDRRPARGYQSQTGVLAGPLSCWGWNWRQRGNHGSSETIFGDNSQSPGFFPGTFKHGNGSGRARKIRSRAGRVSHRPPA